MMTDLANPVDARKLVKSGANWTVLVVRVMSLVMLCFALSGCAALNRWWGLQTVDLKQEDFDNVRDGNLLAVRDSYESWRADPDPKKHLNDQELAILCDIYVRHVSLSKASACLDELQERPSTKDSEKTADAIKGKRALIEYLQGNYAGAAALSEDVKSDGGRYIYALAKVRLGDKTPAIELADEWKLSYKPPQVFLAANLLLAVGDYQEVLAVLEEPERRLSRDYSLSGGKDVFGFQIDPAPLRVDLFGEFGFGLLDTYTYAPRGNVYVEYALAKAELEVGVREAARQRYERILNYPWIAAYRDVHWRALADRARLAELDGDTDQAIGLYKQSVDVIESARASITTDAGRIGFVGDKQDGYGELMRLLLAQGDTVAAFEYSERARSRALVDLLASVEEFGPRGTTRAEQDTAIRDYELAAIEQAEAQDKEPAEVEERTRGLTAEGQRLFNQLAYQVAVLVTVPPATLDALRTSLLHDEALLSYVKQPNGWGLFLVTRDGAPTYEELDTTDLDEDVRSFRSAIIEEGGDYQPHAERLYQQLIGPVAEKLPANLTIVPSGALHYLPFAALRGPDGRFLVEKHAISVLPSADVKRFLVPEAATRQVLALGHPSRPDADPLPGTELEARKVAQTSASSTLLLNENASKANFLELAPGYGILHLASHGQFEPVRPLSSRLLLAPVESGDLTVEDLFVAVQEPWRARVVVLSACETAKGQVSLGEDVVGLQRGFLYAGVDSIVGTLWRIPDDAATLLLVEQFYDRLNRGASGAEALRYAQVVTMRQHPEPRDWAAFVFTGLHGGPG